MKKIPFFEYPRLWNDYKKEYITIIDKVASSGGFILQKELSEFEINLAKLVSNSDNSFCNINPPEDATLSMIEEYSFLLSFHSLGYSKKGIFFIF